MSVEYYFLRFKYMQTRGKDSCGVLCWYL